MRPPRLARDLNALIRDVRPLDRLADVVFLLDSVGALEARVQGLRGPGDSGRVDYLVFIEGATHSSYQGKGPGLRLDRERPPDAELKMITEVTSSATLAFLDLYLKDDKGARACLGSDALAAFSRNKATLQRK